MLPLTLYALAALLVLIGVLLRSLRVREAPRERERIERGMARGRRAQR
jgi:hypothetical protein